MCEIHIHWCILLVAACAQFGHAAFLTILPTIVKERCSIDTIGGSHPNSTSMEDDWQAGMSNFFMIYRIVFLLLPTIPGFFLAWLGDRGWKKISIVVPLIGFTLSRILLILMLTLEWPLEILWLELTIIALSGGINVFWSGIQTLMSLTTSEQERSSVLMKTELANGIASAMGSTIAGNLFPLTFGILKPGVLIMLVCSPIFACCLFYIVFFFQVLPYSHANCKKTLNSEAKVVPSRVVNIGLLCTADLLYNAVVSSGRDILVLFMFMEPLHWNETQMGYGNASGYLATLSSFLGAMVMSQWVSDINLITLGMLSNAAGMSLMAFVSNTYMFYTARALMLLSLIPKPMIRSLLSREVHSSSYSKVFTALQLSMKGCTAGYCLVNVKIYQQTLDWFPGLVFIICSIITLIAIIPVRLLGIRIVSEGSYQAVRKDDKALDEESLLPQKDDSDK